MRTMTIVLLLMVMTMIFQCTCICTCGGVHIFKDKVNFENYDENHEEYGGSDEGEQN